MAPDGKAGLGFLEEKKPMARDMNNSEAQYTQQSPSKSVWTLLSIQHILGTGETVVNKTVCLAPPWTVPHQMTLNQLPCSSLAHS